MALNKIVKREFEVAFSKYSQPIWFRIMKYGVLGIVVYFFWGSRTLWIMLATFFVLALLLHFWYRYQTKGWTRSYGMWKHDKVNKS